MNKTIASLAFVSSSTLASPPATPAFPLKEGYTFRNVNTGDSISTKSYPNLSPNKFYAVFKNAADNYIVIACDKINSGSNLALQEAKMNCPEVLALQK